MRIDQQLAHTISLMQVSSTLQVILGPPIPLWNITFLLMFSPTGLANLYHQLRLGGLDESIVEIYIISNKTSTNDFAYD